MLDARGVYRKITMQIYDFSPEQLQNLLSIVWLYRGETERFLSVISNHLTRSKDEADDCWPLLKAFVQKESELSELIAPFMKAQTLEGDHRETQMELSTA